MLAIAGVRWVRQRYPVENQSPIGAGHSAVRLATTALLVLVGMTGAAAYALVPDSGGLTGRDRDAVLAYTEPKTDNLMQGLNSGDYAARFAQEAPVTLRVSFEAAEPHRISGFWLDSDKLRQ
ncbi:MAG: hypothetical protein M1482_08580 [Chloroflexi bacterium]|nr:hypothetical protein [Chloroflexota bacterium]